MPAPPTDRGRMHGTGDGRVPRPERRVRAGLADGPQPVPQAACAARDLHGGRGHLLPQPHGAQGVPCEPPAGARVQPGRPGAGAGCCGARPGEVHLPVPGGTPRAGAQAEEGEESTHAAAEGALLALPLVRHVAAGYEAGTGELAHRSFGLCRWWSSTRTGSTRAPSPSCTTR
jgi:hypothetical protein